MRTISAKAKDVARKWYLVDADKQVVGRVAVKVANPVFTGKKETAKSYMSFSGFIGGHKSETVQARRGRRPELLIQSAVKGMVPHNRLGRTILKKLYVYGGAEHPHVAQQPEAVKVR
jgi:large subunit ribosomal protein L13